MVFERIGIGNLLKGMPFMPRLPAGLLSRLRSLAHGLENPLSGGGSVRLGGELFFQSKHPCGKIGHDLPQGFGVFLPESVKLDSGEYHEAGVYFSKTNQARPEQLLPYNLRAIEHWSNKFGILS